MSDREDDLKVMPEPPESPTRPHLAEQLMPPRYDPEQNRRTYEDQVVGPNGETRAEARTLMLRRLDELDSLLMNDAYEYGIEGIKLRLRIHRERCGLLGIPTGIGEPW